MPVRRDTLTPALHTWAARVATTGGQLTVLQAQRDPQVNRKTGQMAQATRMLPGVRQEGPRSVVRVLNPRPEAEYTDKGTRPHVIVPRRAGGLLVFYWPKAGGWVFLRRVNHPGNKPYNWWQPVLQRHWHASLAQAARSLRLP